MTAVLSRTFAVIDLLVAERDGLTLGDIATALDIPKSAAHRTLATLVETGHVAQVGAQGRYRLGVRLVSQALTQLEHIPVVSVSGPVLDRLAQRTGELARLGLPDREQIVWVAKRQGATQGLRHDSDAGVSARLARTSTGIAWLSTLTDERVRSLLEAEGFDDLDEFGPNGAMTAEEAVARVTEARSAGYCYTESTYELGVSALAVPVAREREPALAILVVTGPSVRLTEDRALGMVPDLLNGSRELLAGIESWMPPGRSGTAART